MQTETINPIRVLRDSYYPRCKVYLGDRDDPTLIGFRSKGMIRWWRMNGGRFKPSGSTLRPGRADPYPVDPECGCANVKAVCGPEGASDDV